MRQLHPVRAFIPLLLAFAACAGSAWAGYPADKAQSQKVLDLAGTLDGAAQKMVSAARERADDADSRRMLSCMETFSNRATHLHRLMLQIVRDANGRHSQKAWGELSAAWQPVLDGFKGTDLRKSGDVARSWGRCRDTMKAIAPYYQ